MSAIFTARPARPRWHLPVAMAFVLATITGGMLDGIVSASASEAATIRGTLFADSNRNGQQDAAESGFADVLLYVFDGTGSSYLGNTRTGASGEYTLSVPSSGTYLVTIAPTSWRDFRAAWTPSNAPDIQPSWPVVVGAEPMTAPLGLREIVRSTDAPMSALTGPSGIRIESYNDVLSAEQIHAALLQGGLIGPEAAVTRITHDLESTTACGTGATHRDGSWVSFSARCNISWLAWLTGGHRPLFHEYGHAWSLHHAYLTQQDTDFTRYLEVRGLLNDPRLDTSHAWSRREMIAEDYRQLFGSPQGRAAVQENRDIPPAQDVPGLLEYLRDEFTGNDVAPAPDPDPVSAPAPATTPLTIEEMTPQDGEVVSGLVAVSIGLEGGDGTPGAATVTVRIGTRDAVQASWDSATGSYVAAIDTKGLKGSQIITAAATDSSGQQTERSVTVEVARGGGGGGGGKPGKNR